MPLLLRLSFPDGRFYAHPWGQNPARIAEAERPPSPWRLLRALAAGWFRAHPGQSPSSELIEVLEALGHELPEMHLPKVSFSKTIHYHPNPKVPSGKVRHENHFVALGGDVFFKWELATLSDEQREFFRELLRGIAAHVPYFGRAESICELTVASEVEPRSELGCASVVRHDARPGRRIATDCRDVFCANPSDFRATDLWQRRNGGTPTDSVPKHLVQDLIDTPQPLPDGGEWYSYQMPAGWPERWVVRHAIPSKRSPKQDRIIAHYLEFSLHCRVPVPTDFTVSLASLFREAAYKRYCNGRSDRPASFALMGHDKPSSVTGDHQHAFYLPQPNASGQFIERIHVSCVYGFTQAEVDAMLAVESLRWAAGRFPARPVLERMSRELPLSEGRDWISLTPFVPPRWWLRKKVASRQVKPNDCPDQQLRRALQDAGISAPCTVEPIRRSAAGQAEWKACKVHLSESNKKAMEPDHRFGFRFRVAFEVPQRLPFPALGHSAHFGLGQFRPMS
jgi:CRISPR-associated protein Csb2